MATTNRITIRTVTKLMMNHPPSINFIVLEEELTFEEPADFTLIRDSLCLSHLNVSNERVLHEGIRE